jgi:hypothetical protein
MRWSDIPFHPPVTTLRWFAAIWVLLLTGLAGAAFLLRDDVTTALALLGLALVFGLLGVARPMALRPLFVGMMVVTYPVGWLVTQLLLALVFCCLFTPLALLFRLIGRDALGRRWDPARDSYWTPKPAGEGLRSYFRQS